MAIYGYIRKDFPVETTNQLEKVMSYKCREIFIEETNFSVRKELNKLLQQLRNEDQLVVYNLQVFGQEFVTFEEITTQLADKQIRLIAIADQLDTHEQKDFYHMVSLLKQTHIPIVQFKTKLNIEKVRSRGVVLGRPQIEEDTIKKIKVLHKKGTHSFRQIAKECDVSIGTAYKYARPDEDW
ncbi:recombinase family protein [Vagococcus salmoninarum]|nr:recombinase family protein [Vagococcus salmoninarum]